MAFPVSQGNETLGILLLAVKEDMKSEPYYMPILEELSAQLASDINRKKLEDELSRVFSSAPDIISTAGFDGYFKKINPAASDLLGYSEEELLSKPFVDFLHPDDVKKTMDLYSTPSNQSKIYVENRYITKSGKIVWLSWSIKIFYEEKLAYAVAKDITKQKELELLHDQATRLAKIGSWELDVHSSQLYWSDITREIHEMEKDFSPLLKEGIHFYKEGSSRDQIANAVNSAIEDGTPWDFELQIITGKGNEKWVFTYFNREAENLLHKKSEQVIGQIIWDVFAPAVDTDLYYRFQDVMQSREPQTFDYYYPPTDTWYDVSVYRSEAGLSVYFKDINERIKAQEKLLNRTRQLDSIAKINRLLIQESDWLKALEMCLEDFGEFTVADRVYFFKNDKLDEKDPVTSMQLEWARDGIRPEIDNPAHQNLPFSEIRLFIETLRKKRIFNYKVDEIPDKELSRFLKDQDIQSILAFPVFTGKQFRGFIGFDDCTVERRWTEEEISFLKSLTTNLSYAIEKYKADIELRHLYEELETKVKALATSNAELEQFAFVASHDLQEPLRMITSFLALLQKKYGGKLDDKGHSYIQFATDGAKRMRKIILDLLDYSRVGRVDIEMSDVDLNETLEVALSLNKKFIDEKNAEINVEKLPAVYAVSNQMQQLFQNLIHNGLNYQKPDQKPVINVYSQELESEWKFFVKDNGIGIHPDYRERIFNIFQRLHSNEEYSGTGVGLAICKKIVDEHGGTIGVDSEEDHGSIFYFTIPKKEKSMNEGE